MNYIKKFVTTFKNYHYKMITLLLGAMLFGFLLQHTQRVFWVADLIVFHVCIFGLIIYMGMVIYHAALNTWRDGEKVFAIIYSILAIALFIFIGYLIVVNIFGLPKG